MAIKPLSNHYSMETPLTVYNEEALTALQLVGRTAAKVNEVVEDQNKLRDETTFKMVEQDAAILQHGDYIKTEIPKAVTKEVGSQIQNGTFDRAISHYASDLEARLENFMENTPEGGTTLDAELIDIRVDQRGIIHSSAGAAVREQEKRVTEQSDAVARNSGVYAIPLAWGLNTTSASYVYEAKPFLLPENGVSIRVSENGPYYPNNVESHIMHRAYLGSMVNGEFVADDALTAQYCPATYARSYSFIPYMAGVYVLIRAQFVGGGKGQLNANNYPEYAWLPDQVRAYTGKVIGGGNLIGTTPATLVREDSDMKYTLDSGFRGFWWKFCTISSPLPLQFVNRVSCNPDIWIGAKIYKFDPVTRTTEWVKTLHYNQNAPVFGTECVIDFSEYGENYYAILIMGKCPLHSEYQKTGFAGSTAATENITRCGLNVSDIANGVHVEWIGAAVKDNATGGSPVVQRNIELLKNLVHKTVPAMYGDDPSESYNYVLGMDRFAGVFYGGGYAMGMFYYNVSPVAYFTALLNPNSIAYGSADDKESGYYYGIMCSGFTSLLHGYPVPLSTFDYRYNNTIPYFETKPLDLVNDIHNIKVHDIITQGAAHTGHSVMITGIANIGDIVTALQVLESASPSTKENVFWLHNGLSYYKTDPESWYQEAYDFHNVTDPKYDRPIHTTANWVVPYTDPQRVMCSRGYGGVYLHGKNQVLLSVDPDVNEISLTLNGATVGTYLIEDFVGESMNGYTVVNITDKIGGFGTVRVRNDVDDGVEEFHIVDTTGYTVDAAIEGDVCRIVTNHPERVKYVNAKYRFVDGASAGGSTNMNFEPNFDGNDLIIPESFVTDIGTVSISGHNSFGDFREYINIVFETDYDTNTFAVDAQGDAFN